MNQLISANEARLQKALSKQYRFGGVVMSLGQYLEENAWKLTEFEESKIQYNRRKFNNMNQSEQEEYEKKLAVKVTRYYAEFADGSMISIPKMLADLRKARTAA